MRQLLRRPLVLVVVMACLSFGVLAAQEQAQAPAAQPQPSAQQTQQPPANPDTAAGEALTNETEKAEHAEEGEGHEEHGEFKYSSMVQRLGKMIGLDKHGMYWLSMAVNFAIMGYLFWLLLKSKVPQMFRDRTNAIQKALKEAQTASAEATARLNAIEARLAKMDSEVSEIKSGAEREAVAEEERIRAAAEEDKQKVVTAAEAEIAAIARSARADLKSFAASLAVDIATHKIKVDDDTDHALVRQFVGHLGKDGE
ncbi:MAG TPA: ATP synthase F0 subunit B [Candidatus Angelobacter sp.]|nr:ATP synthase F0 subunit B [Candidatus Angelobacter sp.]